jgi:hypothetical protein
MKLLFTSKRPAATCMIAGLALALAASAAQAQLSEAQKSAMRSNCRSDFMAHCMSTSPGSKEALECLQKNLTNLSPGCRTAVAATMPKAPPAAPPAAAAPPPPPPAAAAPPPPAPPPPAKAATEAKPKPTKPKPAPEHSAAPPPPPPPPPAAAAPPPEPVIPMARIRNLSLRARLRIIRACSVDREAVCDTVRGGHGRIIACLVAHRGALSPPCRSTIARVLR